MNKDDLILITGGCGFIGSNLLHHLNELGLRNIIVVDDLSDGKKIHNVSQAEILDYIDYRDFQSEINSKRFHTTIKTIIHNGACSSTNEWDGRYLMDINYEYSKDILKFCLENKVNLIYASSASVYGLGENGFSENKDCEKPINAYAFSKYQFDQFVRRHIPSDIQIVGLRYFNVFGPNESHKIGMQSPIHTFYFQALNEGIIKLFKGTNGISNGKQVRDFIYVKDICKVSEWFLNNTNVSGIYNLGTGKERSFLDVANCISTWFQKNHQKDIDIEFIDFPEHLLGSYQNFTKADLSNLIKQGYDQKFFSLEEGIEDCLNSFKI